MNLSPLPIQRFYDNNNFPLVGGLLFTYIAGTTTKIATYTDSTGGTPNTNPVVLNYRGEAQVWIDPTLTYKFVLAPATDTDPPTNPFWSVDQLISGLTFATLTQQLIGQVLYPRTPAEILAGVTPTNYWAETIPYDIRRYGASKSASNAVNKAALQVAISVVSAEGATSGGVVIVPPNISYGYKVTDFTTFPDFSSCLSPCLVLDYGPGNSFAGYPVAYDGAQERQFYFTPQTTATVTFTTTLSGGATSATLTAIWALATGPWPTTFSNGDVRNVTYTNGLTTATWTGGLSSAATATATFINYGQHQGNQLLIRGTWNPGIWLQSDGILAAPGAPSRTALDNRRAQIGWGINGSFAWNLGQGTQVGPNFTDEDLSNYLLEKLPVSGDTIGHYVPFLVQRKTGNMSFGSGGNIPVTSYDFWSVSSGKDQVMFENSWDVQSRIVIRASGGSTKDAGIGIDNSSGTLGSFFAWSRGTGHLFDIDINSRVFKFASGTAKVEVTTSFATVNIVANSGDTFIVPASTAAAFTINAPTSPTTGQQITVVVRNTSGGALGAATWNAIYKMSAWVNPANANSRSITFRYDNTSWIEMSRTPADVPN